MITALITKQFYERQEHGLCNFEPRGIHVYIEHDWLVNPGPTSPAARTERTGVAYHISGQWGPQVDNRSFPQPTRQRRRDLNYWPDKLPAARSAEYRIFLLWHINLLITSLASGSNSHVHVASGYGIETCNQPRTDAF